MGIRRMPLMNKSHADTEIIILKMDGIFPPGRGLPWWRSGAAYRPAPEDVRDIRNVAPLLPPVKNFLSLVQLSHQANQAALIGKSNKEQKHDNKCKEQEAKHDDRQHGHHEVRCRFRQCARSQAFENNPWINQIWCLQPGPDDKRSKHG